MPTFVISSMENIRGQLASMPPEFEVVVRHDGPLWPELEIASGNWALKGWTSEPKNGTYRYDGKAVSFQPTVGRGHAVPEPEVALTAPTQGLAWVAGSLAHPASCHEAALLARPAVEGYPETARDVGRASLRETLPVEVPVEGFRALVERAPYRFATTFHVDDRDLANAVDKRVETLLLERVEREVDRRAREMVDPDPFRAAQEVADAVQADREAAAAFLLAASRSGATACRSPKMVLAEAADAILHGMHARGEGSDH